MNELFSLQVILDSSSIELAFSPPLALVVLLVGGLSLGVLRAVEGPVPSLARVARLASETIIGLTAVNVTWLMWWATVRFDIARDQVRRGWRTVGQVSRIEAIERTTERWAGLRVVFVDADGTRRRWPIQGVGAQQAERIGADIAYVLGIPFRDARGS